MKIYTGLLSLSFIASSMGFATSPMAPIKSWETDCKDYHVTYTTNDKTMYISWGDIKSKTYGQIGGYPSHSMLPDDYSYYFLENGLKDGQFIFKQKLGPGKSDASLIVGGKTYTCDPLVINR